MQLEDRLHRERDFAEHASHVLQDAADRPAAGAGGPHAARRRGRRRQADRRAQPRRHRRGQQRRRRAGRALARAAASWRAPSCRWSTSPPSSPSAGRTGSECATGPSPPRRRATWPSPTPPARSSTSPTCCSPTSYAGASGPVRHRLPRRGGRPPAGARGVRGSRERARRSVARPDLPGPGGRRVARRPAARGAPRGRHRGAAPAPLTASSWCSPTTRSSPRATCARACWAAASTCPRRRSGLVRGDHPGDPAGRRGRPVHRDEPGPQRPEPARHAAGHRVGGGADQHRDRPHAVLRRQARPADDAQRAEPARGALRDDRHGRRPDGHRHHQRPGGRPADRAGAHRSTRREQVEAFPYRPTRVVESVADLVPEV